MLVLVLALAGWFFVKSWQAGHAANLPTYKIPVQDTQYWSLLLIAT